MVEYEGKITFNFADEAYEFWHVLLFEIDITTAGNQRKCHMMCK
jgi:hypothetical protein